MSYKNFFGNFSFFNGRYKFPFQGRGNLLFGRKNDKVLSYFQLFQYSTGCEKGLIVFAIFLAILGGCFPPIINILYGEFCNLLIDRQFPTNSSSVETFLMPWFGGGKILQNASKSERIEALIADSKAWGIGCAVFTFVQFIFSMISVSILSITASQQISRIKVIFFKSILCKDVSWFDTKMRGNFAGQTSDNLNKLEAGIGGVIAIFAYLLVIFALGVIISLLYGWKLTLAIIFAIPISFGTSSLAVKAQSKFTAKAMQSYTKAGKIAEEVFSSIRTVVAFEGEEKEIERFSNYVEKSRKYGIKRGIASGISNGLSWFLIYCSYAVAFSFGARLILLPEYDDDDFTPAGLLIVFFGIVTALTNFGFASSHFETFAVARGAATEVFNIINTDCKINPCSKGGITPSQCEGNITFEDVYFEYPSRPSAKILRGLNLHIKAGEVVAVVGGSGAGKSTVLQLVQRLYDTTKGEIFLDGIKIKSLNVSWLRQQLGVVGQEPLLFSTTIRENILYGNSSATEQEVIQAAKKANAHDFIMKLRDGYNTVIGQKGSTLSGGQKQRIAIARALIRNPKILLLDEATSALDANSERMVQAALNKAAKGRTTIIVTHKLSTITDVNRIVVIENGVIAEEGTHSALIAANGVYKQLFKAQEKIVRVTKPPDLEVPAKRVYFDDSIALPPTPRRRFSSMTSFRRGSKLPISESLEQYKPISIFKILQWSNQELKWVVVGCLASIIGGTALPIVCVLFSLLLGLFSLSDYKYILIQTDIYSTYLVVTGIIAGISVFLQMYCFTKASMRLSTRLRVAAFRSLVYQEIGYFDNEKNRVGALCQRLSEDSSEVQEILGIRVGIFLQACSTMIIGIVLSFFFDWKISLVAATTIPFVFVGVLLESMFSQKTFERDSRENASKFAVEAISNIKTVACLGKEFFFIEKYSKAIKKESKKNFEKAFLRGFAFAIGQTVPFFGYALTLWYGGMLIAEENLHYKYVIMVSELLIFGTWTLGQSVIVGPSLGRIKFAAGRLNYIFSRKPQVGDGGSDASPDLGKNGLIRYSKVHFAYPTRPSTDVLRNYNMELKAGQSVAVMGPSGSGKSTVIQLLLRFYDPVSGTISMNDVNITELKLSELRKRLGIVSQEPVLFDRTIQENIAYGDNSRTVPLTEVREAAKSANIDSFITSLPLGYQTRCGPSATHLSGGQKQRIAIARALVRNPQILLLDEATSALDPQAESVVQYALDKAASGRTTITVAHRLGAVRHANVIYVLKKGKIIESGTHDQLIKLKGLYYSMHEGIGEADEAEEQEEEEKEGENRKEE